MTTFLARVIRHEFEGELVDIHLQLIRDAETVHLVEGDEFVTVEIPVDPFESHT